MSLRKPPRINGLTRPDCVQWDAPSTALQRWADIAPAAAAGDSAEISIFDQIGETWDGSGFTPKKMAAILRNVGERPVSIAINSPGGDMFDGIAIYNQLAEHPAEVNVKVVGVAASAASIVAMAGDNIAIGAGSFLMIHNAWGAVIGNRHDFKAAADLFAPFDEAMAGIYAARTGMKADKIAAMMDAETWIAAQSAVDQGFANEILPAVTPAASAQTTGHVAARARIDALLAQQGVPRSERRKMLREISGMHNAAEDATPGAGFEDAANRLLSILSK